MHLKALTSNLLTQCGYIDWNKTQASSLLTCFLEGTIKLPRPLHDAT